MEVWSGEDLCQSSFINKGCFFCLFCGSTWRSWKTCCRHDPSRPSSLGTRRRWTCRTTTWARAPAQAAAGRPTTTAPTTRAATTGQGCSVPTSSHTDTHTHPVSSALLGLGEDVRVSEWEKKKKNVQESWTCPTHIDHFYWIMEDLCSGIMTSVRGTSGLAGGSQRLCTWNKFKVFKQKIIN